MAQANQRMTRRCSQKKKHRCGSNKPGTKNRPRVRGGKLVGAHGGCNCNKHMLNTKTCREHNLQANAETAWEITNTK